MAEVPVLADSEYIFPAARSKGHLVDVKVFHRACELAGLSGLTLHGLRHGYASVAGELGCSDGTIGVLLGHRSNTISGRYTHIPDPAAVTAANRVAATIAQRMKGEATAIALRGRQGTGKGVMCSQFGKLFGPHFVHVHHSKHLTGHFNAHLKAASIVFADETQALPGAVRPVQPTQLSRKGGNASSLGATGRPPDAVPTIPPNWLDWLGRLDTANNINVLPRPTWSDCPWQVGLKVGPQLWLRADQQAHSIGDALSGRLPGGLPLSHRTLPRRKTVTIPAKLFIGVMEEALFCDRPVRLELGSQAVKLRQRFYRVRRSRWEEGEFKYAYLRFQIAGTELVISRHPDPETIRHRNRLRALREMAAIAREHEASLKPPAGEEAGQKNRKISK